MKLQKTKKCSSPNKIVSVLSFWFLSCIRENLIVLIAFYSLDHLNKNFQSIVEKVRENAIFFQNTKRTIIEKINFTLLSNVTYDHI